MKRPDDGQADPEVATPLKVRRKGQGFSLKHLPEVKSWVFARVGHTEVPAMVSEVRKDTPFASVDILVPNRLVLQNGWNGPAFKCLNAIPLKKVRPMVHVGSSQAILIEGLLRAVRQSSDRFNGVCVFERLPEDTDFMGIVSTYLWGDETTGRYGQDHVRTNEADLLDGGRRIRAIPGNLGWSQLHARKFEIQEKALLPFMRTSKAMQHLIIAGIRLYRDSCSKNISQIEAHRLFSMIGKLQKMFPAAWESNRRLKKCNTNEDDAIMVSRATTVGQKVDDIRGQIARSKFAKQIARQQGFYCSDYDRLSSFDAPLQRMWSFIENAYRTTPDVLLCDEVANQVVKALALDKQFVKEGLKVLQNLDRIFVSGELLFLL